MATTEQHALECGCLAYAGHRCDMAKALWDGHAQLHFARQEAFARWQEDHYRRDGKAYYTFITVDNMADHAWDIYCEHLGEPVEDDREEDIVW